MSVELATITAIASNDAIKKSDAVIWLTGDELARMDEVIRIYSQGLADYIVITGGFDGLRPFTIPAGELAEELYKKGIAKEKIILEEASQNTFEQATEVMKLVAQKNWQKIIIVGSNFHQTRAYLTFLQAMENANLKIQIFNSHAKDLPWFEPTSLGKNRTELFEDEMKKIDEYSKKGHIYSISDALKYQEWKEKQK